MAIWIDGYWSLKRPIELKIEPYLTNYPLVVFGEPQILTEIWFPVHAIRLSGMKGGGPLGWAKRRYRIILGTRLDSKEQEEGTEQDYA